MHLLEAINLSSLKSAIRHCSNGKSVRVEANGDGFLIHTNTHKVIRRALVNEIYGFYDYMPNGTLKPIRERRRRDTRGKE